MPLSRQQLPELNNFYSIFRDISKEKVKETLEKNGWRSRYCSWNDYEITNSFSELILEGNDKELLLNGTVIYAEKIIEILDKTFKSLGCDFVYEFYDDNKNLILEKRNDS